MTERPTRRELLRPVQLLSLAFVAALFAGVVTLVVMGAFQSIPVADVQRAVVTALVVAGVTFIVTLVGIALLVLAVDPVQVQKPLDRPVLLPPEGAEQSGPDDVTPPASGSDSDSER